MRTAAPGRTSGDGRQRPRVVHVITALGTGGAEREVEYLVRGRTDAEVVCLYDEGVVAASIRAAGVPVTLLGMAGWRRPAAVLRLARLLRERRPDVVHVHLLAAQLWAIPAARLARVPVVVSTEHSLMTDTIEGRPVTPGLRRLYRGLAAMATVTVAVSTETAARLTCWGVPARDVVVIENAVDLERVAFDPAARSRIRAELGVGPAVTLIGGVGRLEPVKRFGMLLDAAAGPVRDGTAVLAVAGEGGQRAALVEHAAALGIADGVRLLGARPDVPDLLSAFDVFASPSQDETFGLAVVEAAANGLPLVHGECPALDELGPAGAPPGAVRLPREASPLRQTALLADALAAARPRSSPLPVPAALERRYGVATLRRSVDELYDRLLAARGRPPLTGGGPMPVTAGGAGGAMPVTGGLRPRRVLVVGAGTRFLSGITYYTHRLAGALAPTSEVSVVLMRRLLPQRLYPGRARVGTDLADLHWPAGVDVLDGVDWYWGPSITAAARFIRDHRPDVVVLQWWTGTVLHSYLAIAELARRRGARVVLEMHETQDVGEVAAVPGAAGYVSTLFPRLLARCSALVVHSEFDRRLVEERFGRHGLPVAVVPHGPYDPTANPAAADLAAPAGDERPDRRPGPVRLLYFGVIRPFKGVEDLLEAFARLDETAAAGFELTVVGETWEGWTRPAELIAGHRFADRITFVNRYVSDAEADRLFREADAVVLPYHRSSSSGPLQMAMGRGLPVLVTSVGGLVEAADGYAGAVFVPPQDPAALAAGLARLVPLVGRRYPAAADWDETRKRYDRLFDQLAARPG